MSETIKLQGFGEELKSAKLDNYTGVMESVLEKHMREEKLLRHELKLLKEKYDALSDKYQNVGTDGVVVASDLCGEGLCIYADEGKWTVCTTSQNKTDGQGYVIESESYPDEVEVEVEVERTIHFATKLTLEFDNLDDYVSYKADPDTYVSDYYDMTLDQEMDDQLRSGDYDVTDQDIRSVEEV